MDEIRMDEMEQAEMGAATQPDARGGEERAGGRDDGQRNERGAGEAIAADDGRDLDSGRLDRVLQASLESFPASDAPGWAPHRT